MPRTVARSAATAPSPSRRRWVSMRTPPSRRHPAPISTTAHRLPGKRDRPIGCAREPVARTPPSQLHPGARLGGAEQPGQVQPGDRSGTGPTPRCFEGVGTRTFTRMGGAASWRASAHGASRESADHRQTAGRRPTPCASRAAGRRGTHSGSRHGPGRPPVVPVRRIARGNVAARFRSRERV